MSEAPDKVERYARLIRDIGFPIAVAIYLVARLDVLLRENTAALQSVRAAIDVLIAKH